MDNKSQTFTVATEKRRPKQSKVVRVTKSGQKMKKSGKPARAHPGPVSTPAHNPPATGQKDSQMLVKWQVKQLLVNKTEKDLIRMLIKQLVKELVKQEVGDQTRNGWPGRRTGSDRKHGRCRGKGRGGGRW
jgi:hypothetical protein